MSQTPPISARVVRDAVLLEAPVQTVWRALVEPDFLRRWCALDARVEAREGGALWTSWDGVEELTWRIATWHPPLRLVLEAPTAPGVRLEYHLEARNNLTKLHMLQAGFASGPGSDEHWAAAERGWRFWLLSLKNAVERHPKGERRLAWARVDTRLPRAEAWVRLAGREGLAREGKLLELGPRDRFEIVDAAGQRFQGRVLVADPTGQFVGGMPDHAGEVLQAIVWPKARGSQASLLLSSFVRGADELRPIQETWTALLTRLFAVT